MTLKALKNNPFARAAVQKPMFEQRADATITRAQEIYQHRGLGYGDTWGEVRFLKMKAVARELGCIIPEDALRALATAAFCDMKYWRFLGGFKDDNLIDGINYDAFLAEEVIAVKTQRN